jgi:hypothetical protein
VCMCLGWLKLWTSLSRAPSGRLGLTAVTLMFDALVDDKSEASLASALLHTACHLVSEAILPVQGL